MPKCRANATLRRHAVQASDLKAAVLALAITLQHCPPDYVNAADKEGLTVLHRCAALSLSECLPVLDHHSSEGSACSGP